MTGFPSSSSAICLPAIIADAEPHVQARFMEVFAATIRNRTRGIPMRAEPSASWSGTMSRGDRLFQIQPLHVAASGEELGRDISVPQQAMPAPQ